MVIQAGDMLPSTRTTPFIRNPLGVLVLFAGVWRLGLLAGLVIPLCIVRPLCAVEAVDQAPTPPTSPAVSSPVAKETPGDAGSPSRLRRISRAWWHDAKLVQALSLTSAQQEKMDGVLLGRMDVRRDLLAKQRVVRTGFNEALRKGNWAAARLYVGQLTNMAAAEAESRANMRIDVFSVLNVNQRKIVVEDYKHIFNSPWLPGYGRRRPIATEARPVGKASGEEQ